MTQRTAIELTEFATGFANQVLDSDIQPKEMKQKAKLYLMGYLTELYLANDFNKLEQENFDSPEATKFADMPFEELLKRIKTLNNY